MARKKAETTTEKKPKEKKILTPADYGPFDILKLMFTDPVKFEEIPLKTLEKSYYIINQDQKNSMVKEIFGISGPFDEAITLEAIEARVASEEGLPAEGEEGETGGSEGTDSDDLLTVTIEAEEMLAYINDYADMENSDVVAAYEQLRSAISSGDIASMRSAMSAVKSLLPGA